jgi:hypothetical protein
MPLPVCHRRAIICWSSGETAEDGTPPSLLSLIAMAPTRKPTADGSQFVRLELDSDLAQGVMEAAEFNERSMPGQIRVVLREWLAAKNS